MFLTLKKQSNFERVAKRGKPFFVRELGFKILNNNLNKNRYGIVVSLKTDKRAVVRNKIRRRICEIIREFEDENFMPKDDHPRAEKQGFDVMILVQESIKDLKYKEVEEKLGFLFRKTGLIKQQTKDQSNK